MKNLTSLLLCFFFLTISCEKSKYNSVRQDKIQINILSVTCENENIFLQCQINNLTDEKLYFPTNNEQVKFFSDLQKKFNVNGYYAFFYGGNNLIYATTPHPYVINQKREDSLRKRKDSLLKLNSLLIKENGNEKNGLWGLQYFSIKKNNFYLKPHGSIDIKVKINLEGSVEKSLLIGDISVYNKKHLEDSHIQIAIRVDSTEAKELLLTKDLDSLKKNNIKIFHGTVYSNKVPLVVEL